MFLEVARPVRREATRATPLAQLQWAFEMTEFDAEARQRREGVDDEPTAVAGVVIAFVGIQFRLDRTVDTDGVSDPLVFAPGMRLATLGTGRGVTERTPCERLHASPAPRRRRDRLSSHGGRRPTASPSRS